MIVSSYASCGPAPPSGSGIGVAGLLASQFAWEEFERVSPAVLPPGLKLDAFVRTLDAAGISGICALACHSGSMPHAHGAALGRAAGDELGLLCFEQCVIEAARRLRPAPAGETVCFVMDWQDPVASGALWHLEHLTQFAPSPDRERLGALGFEHGAIFRPLKLAHSLARYCVELLPTPQGRAARQPFAGLDWSLFDLCPDQALHAPVQAT